jgi:hypothetical protein
MALEAVVFPKEHPGCTAVKARPASLGCGFHTEELEVEDKGGVVLQGEAADALPPPGGAATTWDWDAVLCPCSTAPAAGAVEECWDVQQQQHQLLSVSPPPSSAVAASSSGRRKAAASEAARRRRRRPKAVRNTDEMESQRRNHIAVERNRRRQMNEYLSVLRSAMPPSYTQRVRTYEYHLLLLCNERSVPPLPSGHATMHVHERLGIHRIVDCCCHPTPNFYCNACQILLPPGHPLLAGCCLRPAAPAMPLWLHMSRNL